jgi:hypothetical protein
LALSLRPNGPIFLNPVQRAGLLKGRDRRHTHRPSGEILASLGKLEVDIQQGMKELEEMLK